MKYRRRKMTSEERAKTLYYRKQQCYPWHGPPHKASDMTALYHLVAACYEHSPFIGLSPHRMDSFSEELIEQVIQPAADHVLCWCVLPNHYHVLVQCRNIHQLLHDIGKLLGSISRKWNIEDDTTGQRQCWHRCADRFMRSERHKWATLNYIHHNPVHHRYTNKWTDWPWSSARGYLDRVGRAKATHIWKEYPILDYGQGWDDAEL